MAPNLPEPPEPPEPSAMPSLPDPNTLDALGPVDHAQRVLRVLLDTNVV